MYARIVNEETKEVEVGLGSNAMFYESLGMSDMEVEEGTPGIWYVKGFAPQKEMSYAEARKEEYPPLEEQLDMLYWDTVKGTGLWQETISAVKAKYPKPETISDEGETIDVE